MLSRAMLITVQEPGERKSHSKTTFFLILVLSELVVPILIDQIIQITQQRISPHRIDYCVNFNVASI